MNERLQVVTDVSEVLARIGGQDVGLLAFGQQVLCVANAELGVDELTAIVTAVAMRQKHEHGIENVFAGIVAGKHGDGYQVALLDVQPLTGHELMMHQAKDTDEEYRERMRQVVNDMAVVLHQPITKEQLEEFYEWTEAHGGVQAGVAYENAPSWLKTYLTVATHVHYQATVMKTPLAAIYYTGINPAGGLLMAAAIDKITEALEEMQNAKQLEA